jgi:hypothetical protein
LERNAQQRARPFAEIRAEHIPCALEYRTHAQLGSFSGRLMEFGVSEHTDGQAFVALVPGVKLLQTPADSRRATRNCQPFVNYGQRIALQRQA